MEYQACYILLLLRINFQLF